LTQVEVVCEAEAVAVDTVHKIVKVAKDDEIYDEDYDKLIIASGAYPFVPKMEGTDLSGVFTVRTPEDAIAMRSYIEEHAVKKAVVCGAGFIGLEVAENLHARNIAVTIIDAAEQIMPNAFDEEMAAFAQRQLQVAGIKVLTSCAINKIIGDKWVQGVVSAKGNLDADLVVLAIGIRPATQFLTGSDIAMDRGAIVVNEYMETNVADVYAVGDCALVKNALTNKPQWAAMGSIANLTGRVVAQNCVGHKVKYLGCMGSGVAKLLANLHCGRTGLTEAQAKAEGYDVVSVVWVGDDKAHYYEDASTFVTKLIADRTSQRLLGLQVIGGHAVDKMVDIAVMGISAKFKLHDFDTLDFAYAPPFSTAIHPLVNACYVLENKIEGRLDSVTPWEFARGSCKDHHIIDVQPRPYIAGARWVDLAAVDKEMEGLNKDAKLLLVCTKGKRAYFLYNRLKALGYQNVKILEGGTFVNEMQLLADQ
ncbi:MAG: FAD-dependent oxidoreductase, partial [Erysipelotrichaceae bacterium]|nr:FAD-dependent oxidoreductase [Erysipelotrichaceae bacterium]